MDSANQKHQPMRASRHLVERLLRVRPAGSLRPHTALGSAVGHFGFVLGFLAGSPGTLGAVTAMPAEPFPAPPPIRSTFDREVLRFLASVEESVFCARAEPLCVMMLAA